MFAYLKNSSIYLFANLVQAGVPFLLLPIMTRYLTLEEYGVVSIFQSTVNGLIAFIGLNTAMGAARKYFDDDGEQGLCDYLVACIQILIFTVIVVVIAVWLLESELVKLLTLELEFIYVAIFVTAGTYLSHLLLGQYQVRGDAKSFALMKLGQSVVLVSLSIWLVVSLGLKEEGRIYAQLVVSCFFGFICLYFLFSRFELVSWRVKSYQIRDCLRFGVPLVPHLLGTFLLVSLDKFVIAEKLGVTEVGIYAVTFQLTAGMSILFDSINRSLQPYIFRLLKEAGDKLISQFILLLTYVLIALSLFAAVYYFAVREFAWLLVGESYIISYEMVVLILLAHLLNGLKLILNNVIFYSKRTELASYATFFSAFLSVPMLFFFIDRYGVLGAAYSYLFSSVLSFLFVSLTGFFLLFRVSSFAVVNSETRR